LNKATDSKDSLFNKSIDIFKKSFENEKRKKEIRKHEKKSKPKGYRAKRLGAITFWMLFLFMLLIVFVNVFSVSGKSNSTNELDEANTNKAISAEGIEFSKSFVSAYFTWNATNEKRSDRIERLAYYLPEKLTEQAVASDKKWNSAIARENIVLKEVEDLKDSKARITFQVKVVFEKPSIQEAKKDDKSADKPAAEPEKVKTVKYISVPVFYDEDENRYIVYELPSFSYVDEKNVDKSLDPETDGLKSVADGSTQNIKAFLETFFEAYANDSKDKLTYIVEDPQHQNGLNQTMDFVRLKSTEIFEGKRANEKVIRTEVVLAEPETGIEFNSTYFLVVEEKEMRYTVLLVNDKKYIDDLKQKKKVDEESRGESGLNEDQPQMEKNVETDETIE